MFITVTKEELLKLLESQEAKAKKEDERIAKSHRKDEQAALMKFRADLREAMKWDYATAKKRSGRYSGAVVLVSPSCPRLETPQFADKIANIRRDMRKSPYRIHDGSDIDRALKWVPASERPATTVCD